MHKHFAVLLAALLTCLSVVSPSGAHASADKQAFGGLGIGAEFLSQNGSGTGFYYQAFGGYNFDEMIGVGLHIGSSKVGEVHIRATDFGGFFQMTDQLSGLYGRVYVDGIYASVDGGGRAHGVDGTQLGFAPGIGLGMLIPSAGDFHLTPELSYRAALLASTVNLITVSFSFTWDF